MLFNPGSAKVLGDDRSQKVRSIGKFFSTVLEVIKQNKGEVKVTDKEIIEPQKLEIINPTGPDPETLAKQMVANRILSEYRKAANNDPNAWDVPFGRIILTEADLVLNQTCKCGRVLSKCMGRISGIAIDKAWQFFGEDIFREFGPIFPFYCSNCHVLIFTSDTENIRKQMHQRLICHRNGCRDRYIAQHRMATAKSNQVKLTPK